MFFLVRYCRLLEEGSFRGRTADYFFLMLFGATFLTVKGKNGWGRKTQHGPALMTTMTMVHPTSSWARG